MSHVAKTPFDLTLHLVSVGGNSDGGWIPGNGHPNPQVGRIGQRYVDVQTGHIYGPKSRDGWPAEPTHTLNLGNVAGEFVNMLSRVPALEIRATNSEARITALEGRADSAADLAIQQHTSLQEHGLRIETLEADGLEIRRRLGMVDGTLPSRMTAAEEALNDLARLPELDITDFNSRLDTISTELEGNGSTLTTLRESYTSLTETWTQQVTTLRSEFDGNVAMLQQTLRTHADQYSATAELLTSLSATVDTNKAALDTEIRTRADAVSALAEQITRLSVETSSSSASLTSQQTTMASDLEAYASSVLALSAEFGGNNAEFQEKILTLTNADEALAQRVSTLDIASEDLRSRITNEETARITADSAVLTSARDLVATSESGTLAKIAEEAAARLSGDQAEAYQRSLLDTKFTTEDNKLRASITDESQARVTAIAAETADRNQQISTINGSLGTLSAAITTEATTRASVDGYIGSRYTLSVSTNASNGISSVAGMEIASTSSAGRQTTNHIAFFADRFYITHSQENASAVPFEVVGGTVHIKTAMIRDATITAAKIEDAAITNAKIANATIESAKIQDAAITNAKIANLSVDTIKIQDRAVTTMATAIAAGSNANTLINGGYPKYEGDWRRPAMLSVNVSNGPGTEAVIIWIDFKKVVNGYPASEGGRDIPSGWGVSLIRNGVSVSTQIIPQIGTDSYWWTPDNGADYMIQLVDVPPVGTHTYTVVLNGPYSTPDNQNFYFNQLSLTVLNAKK